LATAGRATGPTSADSLGLRERQWLERDLHDGAQQRLVSLAQTLRTAREKLDTEPGKTGRLLDRSREELEQALRELGDLARGIHPAVLADRGLGAAAEALAERAPLPMKFVSELHNRRLPEQVELTAYFVISETLTNVAKHAAATKATVALTQRDGRLAIEVSDDRGTGLRGLAYRVAAIDGRLEIDSTPQGTIVRARLPCPDAARGRGPGATVSAPDQ
jgi:signal transduction histidine kinase